MLNSYIWEFHIVMEAHHRVAYIIAAFLSSCERQ